PFNHQTITNTFSVTPASQTITYWYAVVLDQSTTNHHPPSEQPFFKIRMFDGSGQAITCAKYDVDVTQAATIGGFDSLTDVTNNYEFYYKNWTQVLIPLTSYIGQNVTITFETSDCLLGGHFGYAYLAVDCAPLTLIAALPQPCVGGNTTLTAPPGLATYSWTGPSIVGSATAQVATVNSGGSYTVSMTTFANSGQVGCALVLSDTIPSSTVSPIASFSATTVCPNTNMQFTDSSTLLPNQGTIDAWNWTFGDGGTSTSYNPTHIYTTAGSFPVSYTITSSVGCTATYSAMVTVNPLPTSSFSAAPVCVGTATNFTNTSTGGVSYHWNFGDGVGTSINQNPTYTYVNAGVYSASLTVTNSFSCHATSTNTVLVNTFPTVSFSAPPACLGTATVFNNSSTPTTNVTYHWNFGDATSMADTSNLQNPTYLYPAAGTYTVTLTLTPTDGCIATNTSVVTVKPIPTVTVTSSSPVVCWNEVVPAPTLSNTPNDPAITYTWANNNTAIGLSFNGIGIPPSFTAGINNTSSNIVGIISITPTLNGCTGPPANYTVTLVPTAIVTHPDMNYCPGDLVPAISLTATPASATPSITWSMTGPFIGLSTTSGGTTIPAFTAISGMSTAQSILITLQDNIGGCAGPISTFSITVNANPVAKFSYASACDGNPTHFTDESVANSGFIIQWHWNFGGGNTLNNADPSYQFTTVGNHTVSLQVITNVGCKNDTTEVVYVNPSALLSFFADTISCTPLVTTFTAVVSMPIKTWNWNFGNGDTASYTTQTAATQTYVNSSHTQNSYYTVSLSVATDSGCVTKITKNNYITVYPKPLAGFAYTPTNADVFNTTIYFHNQSIGASGSSPYYWSFGDVFETVDSLNNSSLANPQHAYSDVPYSYQVTQVVSNIQGCKDSITQTVVILDAVTFYIPNAFSPNNDGTNEGFKGTGIGIDNTTYNLWVFDRWGLLIWHSSDLETSWNGCLNGVTVQQDVYVWKVSFNDVFRKAHNYHGTVTVIR
ncbi:MAG: PKD domain-containing protein, partial [Bacteroidia bacterium]